MITFALSLLVAPRAAEAQQAGRVWRISFLTLRPGEDIAKKILLERLHELGYSAGKNLTCASRSAEGQAERLPQLTRELVRTNPEVLIAGFGTLAAQAAQAATSTIPIVFMNVGDPVGTGLVASLNRPGGNVTGFSSQSTDLHGKRLQLQDESRSGLLPLLLRRITACGVYPIATVAHTFDYFSLSGAVEPTTGASCFLEFPGLPTALFQRWLGHCTQAVPSSCPFLVLGIGQ